MSLRFDRRSTQSVVHGVVRQHLPDRRERIEVISWHRIFGSLDRLDLNTNSPVVQAKVADSSRGFWPKASTAHSAAEHQRRHSD